MKISVALCTFNGQAFINDQLTSIVTQTRAVDEIIISDDNSSDTTTEIIGRFSEKYSCIILEENKTNIGPIRNFEKAIAACTGDIIFLSDQDDVWDQNK